MSYKTPELMDLRQENSTNIEVGTIVILILIMAFSVAGLGFHQALTKQVAANLLLEKKLKAAYAIIFSLVLTMAVTAIKLLMSTKIGKTKKKEDEEKESNKEVE